MPGESRDALSLEASWPLFVEYGWLSVVGSDTAPSRVAPIQSNPDRALWSRFDDVVLAVLGLSPVGPEDIQTDLLVKLRYSLSSDAR